MKRIFKLIKATSLLALVIMCFVESIWLLFAPVARPGLEQIWVLPLVLGICFLLFRKIFSYKEGTLGIKVYYFLASIRYMVQPFLIVLSSGAVSSTRMSIVDAEYYRVALIIESLEIIIVSLTINHYYPKCLNKFMQQRNISRLKSNYYGGDEASIDLGIKHLGWLIISGYAFVLLVRANIWIPALNIYGFKEDADAVVILENTLFSCLKTILFIYFLYRAVCAYRNKSGFGIWMLLTLISAIFSILTYFGSNRSFTVETIIAIVTILLIWFPKYKGIIFAVIVPVSIMMVLTMIVTKQFGVEDIASYSGEGASIQYISNQLEEYTNGPWCIAQSYKASIGLTPKQSFQAVVKDITDGLIVIFELPGLKGTNEFASTWMSSSDIMKMSFQSFDRGQMLSFSGGYFICFGIFGWIIFPIATIICSMLITWFSIHGSYERSLLKQYMYLWSAFLLGLMHCYCTQTLIYCMAKYVLFLWIIILGNKFRIGRARNLK